MTAKIKSLATQEIKDTLCQDFLDGLESLSVEECIDIVCRVTAKLERTECMQREIISSFIEWADGRYLFAQCDNVTEEMFDSYFKQENINSYHYQSEISAAYNMGRQEGHIPQHISGDEYYIDTYKPKKRERLFNAVFPKVPRVYKTFDLSDDDRSFIANSVVDGLIDKVV